VGSGRTRLLSPFRHIFSLHFRRRGEEAKIIFDHIGIVVPELVRGRRHLGALFQIAAWTEEFRDPTNEVFVQFGRDTSGLCYEIIAPLHDDSPVSRTLRTGDRILNHLAYRVEDLKRAADHLRHQGCVSTGEPKPALAYGGRPIQFFLAPLRFIVELIEAPEHTHLYVAAGVCGEEGRRDR